MNGHRAVLLCIATMLALSPPWRGAAAESSAPVQDPALQRLRMEAAGIADEEESSSTGLEFRDVTFKAKGLGLQKLNPELSVAGDMVNWWALDRERDEGARSDFTLRVLDIHLQSYLDPYTRFKGAVEVHTDGTELGEAYVTRFGIARGTSLTLGKFRLQLGMVNRWHKHSLDQSDFPLALRRLAGEGGLNQTGFSLERHVSAGGGGVHNFFIQLTDAENPRLFDSNTRNVPSILCRYSYYKDVDEARYLEVGLNLLDGRNDEWNTSGGTTKRELHTRLFCLDLTYDYEPQRAMRRSRTTWRSELYLLKKKILTPAAVEDEIETFGFYSYLQRRYSRTHEMGIRYDYYRPDSKSYAVDGGPFFPLATNRPGASEWAVTPYLTIMQSPFVKYRLEFSHLESDLYGEEDRLVFQVIFAAGPHKHERY